MRACTQLAVASRVGIQKTFKILDVEAGEAVEAVDAVEDGEAVGDDVEIG